MTGERRVICLGTAVVETIYAVERLPLAPGKTYARSVLRIGGGQNWHRDYDPRLETGDLSDGSVR